MRLTPRIVAEIAYPEGLVRQAYKDSVGVWTWSIGITSASGHNVERYIDNPQSIERCFEVYVWLLETKYLPAVEKAFKGRSLTEAQLAAALSFHWNTGAIGRASWVKSWMAGKETEARRKFMNWRKPSEIIGRRTKERDLFFDGKWAGDGTVLEYTSVSVHGRPFAPRRVPVMDAIRRAMDDPPMPKPIPNPTEPPKGGFFLALWRWLFGERKD